MNHLLEGYLAPLQRSPPFHPDPMVLGPSEYNLGVARHWGCGSSRKHSGNALHTSDTVFCVLSSASTASSSGLGVCLVLMSPLPCCVRYTTRSRTMFVFVIEFLEWSYILRVNPTKSSVAPSLPLLICHLLFLKCPPSLGIYIAHLNKKDQK